MDNKQAVKISKQAIFVHLYFFVYFFSCQLFFLDRLYFVLS